MNGMSLSSWIAIALGWMLSLTPASYCDTLSPAPLMLFQDQAPVYFQGFGIMDSGYMRPCITVVLYRRDTHEAYGVHLSNWVNRPGAGRFFTDGIEKLGGNPARIEVYISGGSELSEPYSREVQVRSKEFIVSQVQRLGFKPESVHENFVKSGNRSRFFLDLERGQGFLLKLPDDEALPYTIQAAEQKMTRVERIPRGSDCDRVFSRLMTGRSPRP